MCLLRSRALKHDVAELCFLPQSGVKDHVDDAVARVGQDLRPHLRLEVPSALIKEIQGLGGALDVRDGVRTFGRIVGDLQQSRVRKVFEGAGEIVDPEIHSRLQHHQHSNSVHIRHDLHLDVLLGGMGLQVFDAAPDLGDGKWLAFF